MKKILTVLIAVLLLFASVSLNVCAAEPLTPVEFYPGVGTITLKYETAITDASQIGSIVLKEEDGGEISLSHYYNNNIVTLKTPNPLEIDGQTYGLTINGEKYNFTLETVWEMEIDDEGNVTNVKSKVPSDKTAVLTSVRKGEVVEENAAIINGAYASFSPDYDQTQHKNLSMVFDYAHINSWNVHLGIRFNASVQTGTYRRYVNGISYSAAFWETSSQTLARTNARGIAIYDPSYPDNKTISGLSPDASTLREAKYQAGSEITYANFRNLKAGSYSETYSYTPDNSLLTGTAIKGSSTINTPNGVTDDLKSFSFAVDKMGATGQCH